MRPLASLVELVRATVQSVKGRDLALHAAAVTFYGGIAVVPVALVTIHLAGVIARPQRVHRLTRYPIEAMPTAIGADRVLATLVDAGLAMGMVTVLASLLPASLYGEGFRRAFVSLTDESEIGSAWRGRLLVLPLLAVGPGLLLALLTTLPLASRLLQRGGWASFGGIVVSFLTGWVVLSVMLMWVYHAVGPRRLGWVATLVGGSFTAANVSGFVHGFVLFCSLPLDLGLPFGGFDLVGGVVAVALWLYLFHVVVLFGYAFTLQLDRFVGIWRTRPSGVTRLAAAAGTGGAPARPPAR